MMTPGTYGFRMSREHPSRVKTTVRRPIAVAVAVAVAGVSLLSMSRFIGWAYPFELLSHFQVQYALAAAALAIAAVALGSWRLVAAAAGCLLLTGSAILPYLSGVGGSAAHAEIAVDTGGSLRLLLANVLKTNREHDRVLELVEHADADVLVFQETSDRWNAALARLQGRYPYTAKTPAGEGFAMSVYSRLPLDEATVVVLGDAGRGTFRLRVTVNGSPLSIVCTHPKQPVPPLNFPLRNDQLMQVGRFCGSQPQPLVLIGDLNTTMWSPWFRRLCDQSRLHSARQGVGVLATWPAALPSWLRVPIDHCLVSDGVSVDDLRLGPDIGSDHLPLIADLTVR